jgi:hypothetical protein
MARKLGDPNLQLMANARARNAGIFQDGTGEEPMKTINQITKVEQNHLSSDTSPFPLKALLIATLV